MARQADEAYLHESTAFDLHVERRRVRLERLTQIQTTAGEAFAGQGGYGIDSGEDPVLDLKITFARESGPNQGASGRDMRRSHGSAAVVIIIGIVPRPAGEDGVTGRAEVDSCGPVTGEGG